MLIATGCLAGYMESHKLSMRVDRLEAFLRFLSSARAEIRYSSMPVGSILRSHGNGIAFLSCIEPDCCGKAWLEQWNHAVEKHAESEGFGKKDLDLLKDFGAGFGNSDTESQLAHFDLYENLTSSALENARSDRDRKSRLYLMLGVLGGTAAAILLC